jgi:hypothetical protein
MYASRSFIMLEVVKSPVACSGNTLAHPVNTHIKRDLGVDSLGLGRNINRLENGLRCRCP